MMMYTRLVVVLMLASVLAGCENWRLHETCQAAQAGVQPCHYSMQWDNAPACTGTCKGEPRDRDVF